MRVLILGRSGQLANALLASKPDEFEVQAWSRETLDLANTTAIAPAIEAFAPQGIINASAYTAVDRAESEPELAEQLNVLAVAEMGRVAQRLGCPLVHVSTDFVFDGSQSSPYEPEDTCAPLGVYGLTKHRGEQVLQQACPQAAIVRTAWVYRAGGANFMQTMLRLMKERSELGVVADQVGTPTSADNLAEVLWRTLAAGLSGIYHYTDAGAASWYDFACAIYRLGREHGLLDSPVTIKPLRTAQYPTPARRPTYSVLDSSALREAVAWPAVHWQAALEQQIKTFVNKR